MTHVAAEEDDSSPVRVTRQTYPQAVQPNQPFTDIASVSHGLAEGAMVSFRFDACGIPFEMEDQRQWGGECAASAVAAAGSSVDNVPSHHDERQWRAP